MSLQSFPIQHQLLNLTNKKMINSNIINGRIYDRFVVNHLSMISKIQQNTTIKKHVRKYVINRNMLFSYRFLCILKRFNLYSFVPKHFVGKCLNLNVPICSLHFQLKILLCAQTCFAPLHLVNL